jgi:two-component system chemotaxis response regulator CheY
MEIRALIVDDNTTNRVLLQVFLSKYGSCHVAQDGKEAVGVFRRALENYRAYHLVCMDICMPEIDGHEAVKQIRECEESLGVLPHERAKIIMTTSFKDDGNILKAAANDCDAYLSKPINTRMLLNHLECFGLVDKKPENAISK